VDATPVFPEPTERRRDDTMRNHTEVKRDWRTNGRRQPSSEGVMKRTQILLTHASFSAACRDVPLLFMPSERL
jgi:hypothetical protein